MCLRKSQASVKGMVYLNLRNCGEKLDLTVWKGKGEMRALISMIIALSAVEEDRYTGVVSNW